MNVRIGINGFGRMGRRVLRTALGRSDVEVVAVNDLADPDDLTYLLKFDSVHGRCPEPVSIEGKHLRVGDRKIRLTANPNAAELDWAAVGASVVIESTGVMRTRAKASAHLEGGAERVIISAPSDDVDVMLVLGINEDDYDPSRHRVLSMASCTTNCLAPLLKVLHDSFGLERASFTTIHAYTGSQSIVDRPEKKRRRGRAGAVNLIPTSTGAAEATARVLPELEGRIDGMAVRVPVPDGSLTDVTVRLENPTTLDRIHEALDAAAAGPMRGILRVSRDALVSTDIIGDPHSSIIDAPVSMALGDRDFKLLSWYDNEHGYACRLLDLAAKLGAQ